MKEKIILVLALILNATMMTISKITGDLNGIIFYGFIFIAVFLMILKLPAREKEIETKKQPFPKIDTDDFITTPKGQIVKAKQPLNLSDKIEKVIACWYEVDGAFDLYDAVIKTINCWEKAHPIKQESK